jgi:thiol-disulfide isomerase/thioredoxin
MDAYVNLHGQMVTTVALRDSLFPAAGIFAIDKAKFGHPKVYGWMVDYFYRGYEANGIDAGIKVLEPYLNDPNCLTSKRLEITRRLEGLKTLVPGSRAPDIELKTEQHVSFVMSEFNPVSDYILVVFWSADCNHCMELINKLYPWHQQAGRKEKVSVVAVSLDETETEIAAWRQVVPSMPAWTHLNAPEGVNSKAAHDYYVLATPMMFLLSSSSKEIVALPGSLNELEAAIQ